MEVRKNSLIEYSILGVLGALVVLSLLVPQLLQDSRPPRLLSLSVLLRDTDSSNWAVARQGMEQAADEMGAELRFLTLTGEDRDGQTELLLREVGSGADAVVVVPIDPEALYETIVQLSSPCPVVALECAIEGGAGAAAPDNELVGRQLAQALLEDWDGGQVVLLDNSASCPEVAARLAGALDTLAQAGAPTITMTALPEEQEAKRWMQWVMTFEPSITRQTAESKAAEGQTFALYGVGASTAVTTQLERGTITAVAAWSDYAAGYLAVQQAVQAVQERSQALEPLKFSIIHGEEIYEPENQKLLFPVMSSSGR